MSLILILNDIRSTHNVGSILRSCDGFGVDKVYLCGITPYPMQEKDERLPYLAQKIDKQINKTALGAEKSVAWQYTEDVHVLLTQLKADGYRIGALEQTDKSETIRGYSPTVDFALIVGNEVKGVQKDVLALCDIHLEIPMKGRKESFNVSVAAAIALYELSNR